MIYIKWIVYPIQHAQLSWSVAGELPILSPFHIQHPMVPIFVVSSPTFYHTFYHGFWEVLNMNGDGISCDFGMLILPNMVNAIPSNTCFDTSPFRISALSRWKSCPIESQLVGEVSRRCIPRNSQKCPGHSDCRSSELFASVFGRRIMDASWTTISWQEKKAAGLGLDAWMNPHRKLDESLFAHGKNTQICPKVSQIMGNGWKWRPWWWPGIGVTWLQLGHHDATHHLIIADLGWPIRVVQWFPIRKLSLQMLE